MGIVILMSCDLCHRRLETLEDVAMHRCDVCRRVCDVCDRELPAEAHDGGRHRVCARAAAECEGQTEPLLEAARMVAAIDRAMTR